VPRSLTDNPVRRIDDDLFGFRPYIEELHELVHAAQELPLTVGVFGSWGTGKSSFLHMWQDLLPDQVRTVWFNPWKYDQKVQVWAALLHSLLAEIRRHSQPGPVREKAAALARAAVWLGVRGAAGVAEDDIYSLAQERFADSASACNPHTCSPTCKLGVGPKGGHESQMDKKIRRPPGNNRFSVAFVDHFCQQVRHAGTA
jgi:hypothetical protein